MTIKFDMKVSQNHASFYDKETGDFVIVDSFDNVRFNLRIGTLGATRCVGSFSATTDEELNRELYTTTQRWLTKPALPPSGWEEDKEERDVPHVIESYDGTIVAVARNLDMAESLAPSSVEGFCVIRRANEDDIASFNRLLGDV